MPRQPRPHRLTPFAMAPFAFGEPAGGAQNALTFLGARCNEPRVGRRGKGHSPGSVMMLDRRETYLDGVRACNMGARVRVASGAKLLIPQTHELDFEASPHPCKKSWKLDLSSLVGQSWEAGR